MDSGNETLFSENSSPCEGGTSPSSGLGSGGSAGPETTPPKLSATLSKVSVSFFTIYQWVPIDTMSQPTFLNETLYYYIT